MSNTPLINLEDIAVLHKCSMRHARDVIVKMAGFPQESPTSTPRNRLWVLQDVLAFITGNCAGITHNTNKALI